MRINVTTNILTATAPAEMNRMASVLWRGQVLAAVKPEHISADIDMSHTKHIDSNGLAAILSLSQEFIKRGGVMRVINPSRQVVQLLEITRLHRSVTIIQRDESDQQAASRPRPILVVEDEPHIRSVTELSMRPLGRSVLAAENGQEALNIARRENPAVIILDYLMPVMDGMTTLRRLKADEATRHIPVIVMSANGNIARGMNEQFEGASFFVTKPFSPSSLRQEVHRLIQDNLELSA